MFKVMSMIMSYSCDMFSRYLLLFGYTLLSLYTHHALMVRMRTVFDEEGQAMEYFEEAKTWHATHPRTFCPFMMVLES